MDSRPPEDTHRKIHEFIHLNPWDFVAGVNTESAVCEEWFCVGDQLTQREVVHPPSTMAYNPTFTVVAEAVLTLSTEKIIAGLNGRLEGPLLCDYDWIRILLCTCLVPDELINRGRDEMAFPQFLLELAQATYPRVNHQYHFSTFRRWGVHGAFGDVCD